MAISVRSHLTALHDRMHEHHIKKAASHETRAAHFKKLAGHLGKTETTEATKDTKAILEALASLHEEMSVEHLGMAEFHGDSKEACEKAADGDLNKLQPTRVSGIAPERPRAIPRPGQPSAGERAAVEPDLAKAMGIDETSWHEEEKSLLQ